MCNAAINYPAVSTHAIVPLLCLPSRAYDDGNSHKPHPSCSDSKAAVVCCHEHLGKMQAGTTAKLGTKNRESAYSQQATFQS